MMESEMLWSKLSKHTLTELNIQGQIEEALDKVESKMPFGEAKLKMLWTRSRQRYHG